MQQLKLHVKVNGKTVQTYYIYQNVKAKVKVPVKSDSEGAWQAKS